MTLLKRCVTIINNRSGHRHNVHAYSGTLISYLNQAGIVHHDIHIPDNDVADGLRRALPNAEALVICGGDGTVNNTVNVMAAMTPSPLTETPLLLVPTGLHNSIATSLGVNSAERAVSSLVVGRTVRVPLWAVRLRTPDAPTTTDTAASSSTSSSCCAPPLPLRYMCSYVAAGTYAMIVQRQQKWKEAQEDYVSLPALLGTLAATSLWTTVQHATPHCVTELSTSLGEVGSGGLGEEESGTSRCRLGPLRMLVAAQMPQLQAGYSLTPTATYHQHRLTVTTATDDVTRLRMCHLLRREAQEGYILSEDGVAMHEGVRGLRIEFPRLSEEKSTRRKEAGNMAAKDGEENADDDDSALLVLDGECVRVQHGSTVTVTPTDLTVQFIVS